MRVNSREQSGFAVPSFHWSMSAIGTETEYRPWSALFVHGDCLLVAHVPKQHAELQRHLSRSLSRSPLSSVSAVRAPRRCAEKCPRAPHGRPILSRADAHARVVPQALRRMTSGPDWRSRASSGSSLPPSSALQSRHQTRRRELRRPDQPSPHISKPLPLR
jgi:hypothetical protein